MLVNQEQSQEEMQLSVSTSKMCKHTEVKGSIVTSFTSLTHQTPPKSRWIIEDDGGLL